MNLAESLLYALKTAGAGEVFGIPGDFALPFFKVMEDSGILPLYTLSHEPAVGFAADGAARIRRGPSVAAVTYGAGAFNLLNSIASAYAEKSPVVVISGGPGRADIDGGLLIHHQAKRLRSQLDVFREVTCDQAILDNPMTASAEIARVLSNCARESRPVYLEIPRDRVGTRTDPVPAPPPAHRADPGALAECVNEIGTRLAHATSPVLVVGVEVRRFRLEDDVVELARRLNIPVVTTFMGRGLLAETSMPTCGTYLGVAGDPAVTELVEHSDGLLLLGVIPSDTNFGISTRQAMLKHSVLVCDGQVAVGHHVYPDIRLSELLPALQALAPHPRAFATSKVAADPPAGLIRDGNSIEPIDIARAVNDLFQKDGGMPVASDIGDCLFTALDFMNTDLVAPGYYATMGFGVPASFGVQVATGRRPLVVVGDGAFQMTGWELLNCQRYGWDPIVLVFNNCGWEMLRAFQPESRFNDLTELPLAEIAKSLGGAGYRVRTRQELAVALARAAASRGRFQLVEIMLTRGVRSKTLARYVAGFKQAKND